MLAIRMQRLGRKGHPTYRVVVQDSRQTPTSGKYVALLGSYDPHTKTNTLVKDKVEFYLSNGAQPSDRVVSLFTAEGIKLPAWVKQPSKHTRELRNPDKLRRNRPAEEAKPAEEKPTAEVATEDQAATEPTNEEVTTSNEPENTADKETEEETSEEPNAGNSDEVTAQSDTAETDEEPEKKES